jgi:branched-chain amino acid transport system ATP-binding protein
VLLETERLTKRFGGLVAVDELDLQVDSGEIVGLIGPNGAGKTTVFNLITGIHRPTQGRVLFDGRDVSGKKPHRIAAMGIGRTFQLNLLFGNFTVLQNVSASFQVHPHSSLLDMYFNTRRYRNNEAFIARRSLEVLHILGLEPFKDELARNLPHGYQKMLGVARALSTDPRLILLDEPLGGMNPSEIEFSLKAIANARDAGVTVLIVEHNMQILSLCNRVVVISFGQKICEGTPDEVRGNKDVISAYFGTEHGTP